MGNENEQVVAARRLRLQAWIAEHFGGSQKAFREALPPKDRINQGMLSALLSTKSFGEKQAAGIERRYQMPRGYLVNPLEPVAPPPSQPVGLDLEILQDALEAVKHALADDYDLDLVEVAPIIAYAYRERTNLPGKLSAARLQKFRLAVRDALREGTGDGRWTGRTAGAGEEGRAKSPTKAPASRGRTAGRKH